MSKKETNSFIFEGEKIKHLFDEDDEDDKIEMKKLNNILSNSSNKIEEEDDNKDLNNITSVSETDKVYLGEVKDATKKSQESEYEIEDELNETSLTINNMDEEPKELNEIMENNFNNKNNNEIKKEIEIKKEKEKEINSNKHNLKIENQKLNDIVLEKYFLNKKENTIDNNNIDNSKKNKNKHKAPIFLIKKIKMRSKKIQLLRKKKGLHLIRKKDSDTIRKKIKTYFHNYLINYLNSKIKKLNIQYIINNNNFEEINTGQKLKYKKINKFLKFNNKFTTNITINANRNLLTKKISHLLMKEPISSKYKTYDSKNNYYLTNYLLSNKAFSEINHILDLTYKELYNEFIKSSNYKNILKIVKNRDGDAYINKFKSISNNYIEYFNNDRTKKESKYEFNKKYFYKDKYKSNELNQKKKEISNFIINEYINNSLSNEVLDLNNKNKNDSLLKDNISLMEDFHEFLGNSLIFSEEEKKPNEFNNKYNNIMNEIKEQNHRIINNFLENNNSYEKEKCLFLRENKSIFEEEKKNKFFFDNNNLSKNFEDSFEKEMDEYCLEDNSIGICKKRTNDYSKTNESDYNSMKFIENTFKNDISSKVISEGFKEFI